MVNKQVYQHFDFARRLPHFLKLPQDDQIQLYMSSWNELLILQVAYMSVPVRIKKDFFFSSIMTNLIVKVIKLMLLINSLFSLVYRTRATKHGWHVDEVSNIAANVSRTQLHTGPQYGRSSGSCANI